MLPGRLSRNLIANIRNPVGLVDLVHLVRLVCLVDSVFG